MDRIHIQQRLQEVSQHSTGLDQCAECTALINKRKKSPSFPRFAAPSDSDTMALGGRAALRFRNGWRLPRFVVLLQFVSGPGMVEWNMRGRKEGRAGRKKRKQEALPCRAVPLEWELVLVVWDS